MVNTKWIKKLKRKLKNFRSRFVRCQCLACVAFSTRGRDTQAHLKTSLQHPDDKNHSPDTLSFSLGAIVGLLSRLFDKSRNF
jgi:hypothetical protein